MLSRRLVDGLLVAVARRVRRWADRILAERDGAPGVAQQAPQDASEAEPPDGDGPPAHWLEMVRARAPHLLSRREQAFEAQGSPRPASEPEPAAVEPRFELAEVAQRIEPPASEWSSPATTGSPERGRAMRVDSVAARPAAPRAGAPDVAPPPREPARSRWPVEPDGEPRPTRWHGEPIPPVHGEAPPQRSPHPHSRPLAPAHAEPHRVAPPAPWRASVPEARAPAAPIAPSSPAAPPTRATLLHEPAQRSFDRARDAHPHPHPAAPPPRPASWPHLPDEGEPREAAAPVWPRSSAPPPRPVSWPRLPDEDEHEAPPQARPTEPSWPVLPSDAPDLAAPVLEEDHGRSARLRGEQRGAR